MRPGKTVRFILALSLSSLLMACASLKMPGSGSSVPPTKPSVVLNEVPFFPQDDYQCGPSALATLLNWSGEQVTPAQLTPSVYIPARQGSLQIELMAQSRSRGYLVYQVPSDLSGLYKELEAGHPVLVLQNLGLSWWPLWHYAVVIGINPKHDKVILRSGRDYKLIDSTRVFRNTWERAGAWGIVVLPPQQIPASADVEGYVRAVAALEQTSPPAAAHAAYEAGVARWPQSLPLWLGLANTAYAQHDYARAEQTLREALTRFPQSPVLYNNLAMNLLAQNKLTEAMAAAEQAVALGGSFTQQAQATLREVRCRSEQHPKQNDCPVD
jgi:tetratricopeptide (TPR) repeat protein